MTDFPIRFVGSESVPEGVAFVGDFNALRPGPHLDERIAKGFVVLKFDDGLPVPLSAQETQT